MKKLYAAALAAAFLSLPAMAQQWPAKPIKLVVTFAPATTPDTLARIVGPHLQAAFGQPIIIENKAGGAGNIGADAVAKADPDGYTFLVGTNGPVAVNKALFASLPFDPDKDLRPVSLFVRAPQLLVVNPNVPVKTLKEFVAYAKANPTALDYGTTGAGSASHLTMELLKFREGINVNHIPYRGFPLAVQDMLGGQVESMFAIAAGMLPYVKDGRVRALAVTSDKKFALAPDVPTVVEAGYPYLDSFAWIGLLAPAKTPDDIVNKVQAAVAKGLAEAETKAKLEAQGYEVVGSTPAQFATWIKAEADKWGDVIKRTGAKAE